jgi:3-deoxy-D-manno-octulosonic-acid transferase
VSLAWTLYRAAAPWAGRLSPLALPLLGPEERALWPERRGRASVAPADVWLHAASLGETGAVRPLIERLMPPGGVTRVHATATTRSGRARLATFGIPSTLAPLDDPAATARFFEALAPRRLLIIETELWPHWLLEAERRGVPVAFVSARLSARSLAGYMRLGAPLARLAAGLAAVLCQTEADARRWRTLGVPEGRCAVIGNLKNDALPEPEDRSMARRALGLDPDRPLLVLGSVRPGELAEFGPMWHALPAGVRSRWQGAVVARHPGAAATLEREARAAGLRTHAGRAPDASVESWRLVAELGVLRSYYAACDVAFVGGSLAPFGGHHPLEPAATGAAVAIGPHHGAQQGAVDDLTAAGALPPIRTAADTRALIHELLTDDGTRARRAAAALAAASAARGATSRAMGHLERLGFWPIT